MKKRQKVDRSSTAAYAASQPLFDALRNATESIGEQSARLTQARDISQAVHARIVNGDQERHEALMDSAVTAWKTATDTYCAIFEQLVSITAAEPTEGRDAGKRHLEFADLLESAKRARKVVEKYESAEKSGFEDTAQGNGKVKVEPGTGVKTADKLRKRSNVATEVEARDEVLEEPVKSRKKTKAGTESDAQNSKATIDGQSAKFKPASVSDDGSDDEVAGDKHRRAKVNTEPTSDNEEDMDSPPEYVNTNDDKVSNHENTKMEPADTVNACGKRRMVDVTLEPKTSNLKSALNAKIGYDKTGTKTLWENGELKVPLESLTPDEAKTWAIIKQRKRRTTRRGRAAAEREQARQDEQREQEHREIKAEVKVDPVEQKPSVEYEDVTAQVEQRLKAKAEKKNAERAAKKEKKRKRESGDSFTNAGPVEESVPEPLPALGESLTQKPAKKKIKKERIAEDGLEKNTPVEVEVEPAKEVKKDNTGKVKKRNDAEVEDGSEKQQTKKRKKSKGF